MKIKINGRAYKARLVRGHKRRARQFDDGVLAVPNPLSISGKRQSMNNDSDMTSFIQRKKEQQLLNR